MLDKISNLDELGGIGNRAQGLIYPSFLAEEQLGPVSDEAERAFITSENKSKVDGLVGVAYERYTGLYLCPRQGEIIPVLFDVLESKIFSLKEFANYSGKWCAALVRFNQLDGMTSHRDYSYNRLMLGTLVLDGEILFGSGSSKREEAYDPSDMVLARKGDFIALRAPNKDNEERPFFSIFSPTSSLIMRLWMRDQSKCPSCSGMFRRV